MTTVSDFDWWPGGIANLRRLVSRHGEEAGRRAVSHAEKYRGQRAAMVYDVVASRQRRYFPRVVSMVEDFQGTDASRSLVELAQAGAEIDPGLQTGEAETIRRVSGGLARYCEEHNLDEDAGVRAWAHAVEGLEHAHRLDPYVGCVKGMGPALFAYLRMRCGADAIKPDLRVRAGLRQLGFQVPDDDPHALLVVADHASREVGISKLVLDQLLWWLDPQETVTSEDQDRGTCPRCGSTAVTHVVYGMVPSATVENTPFWVEFAGCVIHPDSKNRRCEDCGSTWDEPSEVSPADSLLR